MFTEHAQMHAGKCEGVKSENPKGEGKLYYNTPFFIS